LPLSSPLLELDNVLLAGHLAGLDEESHDDTFKMGAETIIHLFKGEWPGFCIQNLKGVKNWSWDRK
jgi:phosphoglycerate dehydrogenase-like enzyme